MKKVNVDSLQRKYLVRYAVNDNNSSVKEYEEMEFDNQAAAMEFIKYRRNRIVFFRIDVQDIIVSEDRVFKADVIQGKRQYIGELYSRERLEKEEKNLLVKFSTFLQLDNYFSKFAVKPYADNRYESLFKGEKVLDKDLKQVYPPIDELNQKSR